MKERPILFNALMVKAILEGRKTQTRKVLSFEHPVVTGFTPNGEHGYWKGTAKNEAVIQQYITSFPFTIKCPFGVVGDRLWVRETWSTVNLYGEIALAYKADGEVTRVVENESFQDEDGLINYDDPRLEKYSFAAWADDLLEGKEGNWKPSIHMPRWVSRILLEITNVRVERLNQISRADAVKEGLHQLPATGRYVINKGDQYFGGASSNPCEVFQWLWDEINGTGSWNKNPWVWVTEFKVIQDGGES